MQFCQEFDIKPWQETDNEAAYEWFAFWMAVNEARNAHGTDDPDLQQRIQDEGTTRFF